jgi:hypothetical protein
MMQRATERRYSSREGYETEWLRKEWRRNENPRAHT